MLFLQNCHALIFSQWELNNKVTTLVGLFADKTNSVVLHIFMCVLSAEAAGVKGEGEKDSGCSCAVTSVSADVAGSSPCMWLHLVYFCLTAAFGRCSRPRVC